MFLGWIPWLSRGLMQQIRHQGRNSPHSFTATGMQLHACFNLLIALCIDCLYYEKSTDIAEGVIIVGATDANPITIFAFALCSLVLWLSVPIWNHCTIIIFYEMRRKQSALLSLSQFQPHFISKTHKLPFTHLCAAFLLHFSFQYPQLNGELGWKYKQLLNRQFKNKYNNQQESKLWSQTNQRMTHLIERNQHLPKLVKNKQLQNPYQSNATTVSDLSRIFLLNDRRKVTLTQSSQSQQQQHAHNHHSQLNRFPTFKPNQTMSMSEVSQQQSKMANISQHKSQAKETQNEKQKQTYTKNASDDQKQNKKVNINTNYKQNGNNSPLNNHQLKVVNTPQFAVVKNKGTPNESKDYFNQQFTNTQHQTETHSYQTHHQTDSKAITNKNKDKDREQKYQQPKFGTNKAAQNNKNKTSIQSKDSIAKQLQSSQSEHEDNELIAQQQNVDHLLSKAVQVHNRSKAISQINKPSLQTASRVIGMHENSRGSLIDKIKAQTFCESRVLEQKQYNDKNTNVKTAESHIINLTQNEIYKNKNEAKMVNHATNTKRRTKIFSDFAKKQQRNITTQTQAYPLTPRKAINGQTKPNFNNTQFFNQTSRYIQQVQKNIQTTSFDKNTSRSPYSHQQRQRSNQRQNEDNEHKNNSNNYAICPHTQCILKSLQIIDKLTNRNETNNFQLKTSRKINKAEQKQNENAKILKRIQSQAIEVSMQMDNFIAQITLQNLLEQDRSRKIKQIKIQIERLHAKIKESSEEELIMRRKQYALQQSYIKALTVVDYRWELCLQLQKMSKLLHYMQVVQERYKIWKFRLNSMSQRIKDIMKVDRQSQQRKLADMSQHIRELEESKFYGTQVTGIGIVEAYNSFVEKEMKELRQGMECIKNDILSR